MNAQHMTQTFTIEWDGITININWEAHWLNSEAYDVAHLDIESVKPEGSALPITETGYLSHFTSRENISAYGGPAAFVLAWLEDAAGKKAWKRKAAASRQFALF